MAGANGVWALATHPMPQLVCRMRPRPPDAVRLAGGQGFYGDTPEPLDDVLTEQPDYVCLEALAELTLSILSKDRQRDAAAGWTRDLPGYISALLPAVQRGETTVITNAGGINPPAAARAVADTAAEHGAHGVTIATVTGDDLLARSGGASAAAGGAATPATAHSASPPERLLPAGFPEPERLRFANAYLGARPIVEALERGADIVITGRVADAALFLAPLAHRHGWGWTQWDRLAAGTVVGHLLECSGQATGGNHGGRWWDVAKPWRFGLPLADVAPDGAAEVFKPQVAGGRVDFDTVRQQLLYEVGDPAAYLTPDVTVDLTSVTLRELDDDAVAVAGAGGAPAPAAYKVVAAEPDGYAAELSLALGWPHAPAKARATADLARQRVAQAGLEPADWHVELFGVDALHGPAVPPEAEHQLAGGPSEVVVRLAWKHADAERCAEVARAIVPLILSGPPPGCIPVNRARPRPSAQLALHTGTIDCARIDAGVTVHLEQV